MAAIVRHANGKLDEVVAENVTFHLEQMNDGHWWIGITHPNGNVDHINLTTKRNAEIVGHLTPAAITANYRKGESE